ncbi:hypothetical protein Pfo_019514 [Paulownia fortunei]|nr:hypothetical protein Pfo_019514 [Paulownia fortunei]
MLPAGFSQGQPLHCRCICCSRMQGHKFKTEFSTGSENRPAWRIQSPSPFHCEQTCQENQGMFCEINQQQQAILRGCSYCNFIKLSSQVKKRRGHIFSAGFFTFKPLKQPEVCDQKPSINNFKKLNSAAEKSSPISNPNDPTFVPPIQDPPSDPPTLGRYLPPLPQLPNLPPLPQLPRLPPLPGIPFLPPVPKKETATKASELSDNTVNQPNSFPFPPNPFNPPSIFPPNPFQPPPSLLPPNPLQPPPSVIPPVFPSPPPSVFPPLFPSPPSPPFFHLPPIPGLTPSPSPPPPPPSFPIPLPPFPFQPTPGFPGVPPSEVSSPSKTSSP